jgi:actin-related protein
MKSSERILAMIQKTLDQLDKEYKEKNFGDEKMHCERHIENVAEWEILNDLKSYILGEKEND